MPDRPATLAHYIIWRSDPKDLGATKLNKVLWFADVEHYRMTGKSISGATAYEKRQFGPVPKGINDIIRRLQAENKVVSSQENYFGFPKTMFMSLEQPDLSELTADEISVVDVIADVICKEYSAKSISNESHDALWDETPLGGELPIGAAAMQPGEILPEDVDWARQALA